MSPKSNRYTLVHRFNAHKRGVYALALSDTGKLLASGGDLHVLCRHRQALIIFRLQGLMV